MGIEKTDVVLSNNSGDRLSDRFDITYRPHDDGRQSTQVSFTRSGSMDAVTFDDHKATIELFNGSFGAAKQTESGQIIDFAGKERNNVPKTPEGYQRAYARIASYLDQAKNFTTETIKDYDRLLAEGGQRSMEVTELTKAQAQFMVAAMAIKDGVDVATLPGFENIGQALQKSKTFGTHLNNAYSNDEVVTPEESTQLQEELKQLATKPAPRVR